MRTLLLSALLAVCATASAATEQSQDYVKKINAPIPDVTNRSDRLEVLSPYQLKPLKKNKNTPEQAAAKPVEATAGLPMIPASDPNNNKAATADSEAEPVTAQTQAASSGLTPGKPVTVYTTMAQAAAAGVDPLGENKDSPSVKPVTSTAPAATASEFEILNPASWLAWLQTNKTQASQYGLMGLGGLIVLLVGLKFLRRRSGQE